MAKVIIAGTRTFDDYRLLCDQMYYFCREHNLENVEVVSGHAKGADALGERWATERGAKLHIYPANWDQHGKKAGYLRNVQMADNAEYFIAFWDGESKGTKMMIDIAQKKGLKGTVVNYAETMSK